MATRCFGYLKARVARITRLNADGIPVVGSKSVVTTNGFIRIALNMEYEDGQEYVQKNAWGDFCVNEKDSDRLKAVTPTIDFCNIDPDAVEIVTGARLLMSGTDAVGFAMGEAAPTGRFALEAWSKVAGSGTEYVYWLLPNLGGGRIGNITLEQGTGTFSMTSRSDGAPNSTTWTGATSGASPLPAEPHSPGYLPTDENVDAGEHIATNVTATAPPAATCGATALA